MRCDAMGSEALLVAGIGDRPNLSGALHRFKFCQQRCAAVSSEALLWITCPAAAIRWAQVTEGSDALRWLRARWDSATTGQFRILYLGAICRHICPFPVADGFCH